MGIYEMIHGERSRLMAAGNGHLLMLPNFNRSTLFGALFMNRADHVH